MKFSCRLSKQLFQSQMVYCIVFYCIIFYCIVLYCIVLYCIVLYCILLNSVESYFALVGSFFPQQIFFSEMYSDFYSILFSLWAFYETFSKFSVNFVKLSQLLRFKLFYFLRYFSWLQRFVRLARCLSNLQYCEGPYVLPFIFCLTYLLPYIFFYFMC